MEARQRLSPQPRRRAVHRPVGPAGRSFRESSEFEVIAGLGFAYYFMDDFQKATEYLEKAMTIRPPDTELLNAIGDCHLRLGNPDKAKAYFERSLELEPSQEAVKRRLAELSSQGS